MLHHALATIEKGAVGNHAIAINESLKDNGCEIETFAETIRPEFEKSVKTISELSSTLKTNDVVFYQFANPSIMADLLYEKSCRLIVNYHNVTPAHFFTRWSPATASEIGRARLQLARLADVAIAAVAVSEYNAAELVNLGYKNVEVIPPVFSEQFYDQGRGEVTTNASSRWIYVGRIAPHKNIHILLRAFEYYRDNIDSNAQLTIVGTTDTPLYGKAIEELIYVRSFGDSVTIYQNASINELINLYRSSTVFVSASEHEGFCVPIVEAMSQGIPVVGVNEAAVGDTIGSAGIVLDSCASISIAHAIEEIENNSQLRANLISKGYERAIHFDPRITKQSYAKYLMRWI